MRFDARGLVPVVVQDHLTGEVRMVAYASAEAVRATRASGRATFFSRSRGELWEKGATSGNTLAVKRILVDCDADTLIYLVEPNGPTCHTGAPSCFFRELGAEEPLDGAPEGAAPEEEARAATAPTTIAPTTELLRLEATLEARRASTAEKSYTKSLYEAGVGRIGEKVREEADEIARALAGESDARVTSEAADVLYHLMVGLRARGISLRSVLEELQKREKKSGHEEKAARRPDP